MLKKVQLFILISLLSGIYAFGQDRVAHFTIKDKPYSVKVDDDLDIMFVEIFDDLKRNGEATDQDRVDWVKSYYKFTIMAIAGTYNIESIADYVTNVSYSGMATKEDLGIDPTGKNRKYRHCKEPYQRMARLNYELWKKVLIKYNRERK